MRGVTSEVSIVKKISKFQLTRLMRGVTFSGGSPYRPNDKFQLTRLMRGVT